MPITSKQMDHAVSILADPEKRAAKARAAAEYLSDMTKVVKAKLEAQSNEKSAAARESWALAHPTYETHLEQLKLAREEDYSQRERKSAAEAIVEIWRTEQSNQRAAERIR